MSLDNIFSNNNMLSYSEACVNMALDMADTRKQRFDFDTLVIPSRGAFPFFLGMVHAFKRLQNADDNIKTIYEAMAIQPMLEPLMPRDTSVSSDVHKKSLRVLLIPFTADLNIPRFDAEESNEEYTEKTREYWARVTHSFFKEPQFRAKNPYFKTFVDIILRDVEGREKTAEIYETFPKIKKFAMIDTVISGRASNDILGAFDDLAIEDCQDGGSSSSDVPPFAFLIVDENGNKLEKHKGFNAYLQGRKDRRMANLYPIPKIVSEDKNSALLGVSATIYPSLMRASKCVEYHNREFFIGAGSWHVNPESVQFKHFLKFMDLVYSGIDVHASQYSGDEVAKDCLNEKFEAKRLEFINATEDSGAIELSEYDIAADHRLDVLGKGAVPPYETRSHVIHVPFNQRFDKNLITKVCNYDSVTCKKNPSPSDSYEDMKASNRRAAILLPPSSKH
jgi:hypothetical protein